MKLGKVLKYVDKYITCRIWAGDSPDSEFDKVYEGYVKDVPKNLKKNYRLIEVEENDFSEAIFPFVKADGVVNYKFGEAAHLRITVIKKEKKNGKRRNK